MPTSLVYRRLGMSVTLPERGSDLYRLAKSVRRIAETFDTPELDLLNAAALIDRVAKNPKAMDALYPTRKSKSPHSIFVAIDYLATKELLEIKQRKKRDGRPSQALNARHEVAEAWGEKENTVKSYVTMHKSGATHEIKVITDLYLVRSRVLRRTQNGKEEFWTRETLLEALIADVREHKESEV